MLTVQQLADKLEITPQAVYKKINQQLVNELKPFIVEVKRGKRTVKMIESRGVEIIGNSLKQPVQENVNELDNKDSQRLITILEETIDVLRGQLAIKDEQLIVKDKQIERLGNMIESNQELNKNNQVLLHRQQDQTKMIEHEKKRFSFKRWFGKDG